MTRNNLIERLKSTKIPYAEIVFDDTTQNPAPDPPYVCYLYHSETAGPDDYPQMLKKINITLELYTSRYPDDDLAKLIEEKVLFDVDFEKENEIIKGDDIAKTYYDIIVIEKKGR